MVASHKLSPVEIGMLAHEAVVLQGAAQKSDELAALAAYLTASEIERPSGRPNPLGCIVEIGAYQGGSTWFWRKLAPDAIIVSIDRRVACEDCQRGRAHNDCPRQRIRENADHFLERDSRDPVAISAVAGIARVPESASVAGLFSEGAGVDLLLIDGGHEAATLEADFQTYAPMLSGVGVVAIHDIAGVVAEQVNGQTTTDAVQRFWHNVARLVPQAFSIVAEPKTWGGWGVVPKPE